MHKLAVFADLHLDASFAWAGSDLARQRRQDLRDALVKLLDIAMDTGVDAIICAGDLYEHEYVTPDTARFLRDSFARVAPTPVFIAPGNHDWLGPQSVYARKSWSQNVRIFCSDRLEPIELKAGLTLWGAAHLAPANTDSFLSSFTVDRDGVNLALFHGSERGSFPQEEGKEPHAAFDAEDIERAGLDHAFVGHFHRPRDAERHTYPGNPEPLTFGEGNREGLVLAEVLESGAVSRERQDVHVTSMHVIELDVTGCSNRSQVRERAREVTTELNGLVRLVLKGEADPDLDLRLDDLRDLSEENLRILPQNDSVTVAYDLEAIGEERTVRGEFVRLVEGTELDVDQRRRVIVTGLRAFEGRDDLEVL